MTRPLRIQLPGAFYYVSQHGNGGSLIFKREEDYEFFIETVKTSLATYIINLHSFVLLKNHFHLLIETTHANISEFMRHLNISYTAYFNRTYKRTGHLYGGRYKSVILEKENYLSRVSQYLHLNPINTGTIKRKNKMTKLAFLNQWKWSSLPGFAGLYPRYHFVCHHAILNAYGGDTPQGRKAYLESLRDQFEDGFSIKERIIGQTILGSRPFVEQINAVCLGNTSRREQPGATGINRFVMQEKILDELQRGLRCDRDRLLQMPGDFRSIAMDVLYRYAGLTNLQIGDLMGLDYSSISLARKKIRDKRLIDQSLNARIIVLEKRLQRLANL